ncbi:hypothetical protein ABIA33_006255 [Streptacidiphilus sp. MAP12-16]|uniref:hypothetical protein n=1 Tax=Streptacidiphilus sp. MAP12-16 TaxID=3156300 RepID=UPI003513FC10
MNARRSARAGFAATAAIVVMGATQLLGSGAAWAADSVQGSMDNPAAHAPAKPVGHHGDVTIALIPVAPTAITAGGAPVDFGIEMANFTGAAYQYVAPEVTVLGLPSGGIARTLPASNFTFQAMVHGAWLTLPVVTARTGAQTVNTTALAQPLANGHATRLMFRITVNGQLAKDLTSLDVNLAAMGDGRSTHQVDDKLKVQRTTATTSPKPSAPAAPTKRTPAPATPSASASATTAAAPMAALAQTGGGSDAGTLLGFGAALLALGGGAAAFVRHAKRRTH